MRYVVLCVLDVDAVTFHWSEDEDAASARAECKYEYFADAQFFRTAASTSSDQGMPALGHSCI